MDLASPQENCAVTVRRYVDIKEWYINVITPNFETMEARTARGCFLDASEDVDPMMFPATPLTKATNQVQSLEAPTGSPRSSPQPSPQPSRRMAEANAAIHESYGTHNEPWDNPADGLSCVSRTCGKMNPGSIRTCSSALAATALGAGALALPYAFSLTGIALGILTMAFAAMVSSLSLQVLMVAARYSGSKSYASLLELAVGNRIASVLLDVMITLNGIGAITCILIFEGDFLPNVFVTPPWGGGIVISRTILILGAALAAWPLTWPSEISALRYVAVAVPIVLVATVLIVAAEAPGRMEQKHEDIIWWDFDLRQWLKAVAIMVNAFANHQNAVPTVNQLDSPSIARIVKATVNGNLIVWVLLVSLGVSGYLTWGSATMGNFIKNYPSTDAGIWCCRVMLSLICYFVLPVALLPTSKSLAQLLLQLGGRTGPRRTVGRGLHITSATCLLVGCTGLALIFKDVTVVIGILGGVIASSLMFWFPALVFWKLLWPVQPTCFRLPVLLAMLFFGICGWASVVANILPS